MSYYIWGKKFENGAGTDGVVTRKRIPLTMDISDIVGEFIIDGGDEQYMGVENVQTDFPWVAIVNNQIDGNNILRLSWFNKDDAEYDGVDGIDEYEFVEELIDVPFDDTGNYCLSCGDFLNIWYERSGRDANFDPDNIDISSFYGELSLWEGLDSRNRILWNDGNGGDVFMDYLSIIYPIENTTLIGSDYIDIYKNSDLGNNQLIRVKDIPDFEIYNCKMDGYIRYPRLIPYSGTGYTTMRFGNVLWSTYPSISYGGIVASYEEKSVDTSNYYIYNDIEHYHGVPSSIMLLFTLKLDGYHITDSSDTIYVTFGNDETHAFTTVDKTYDSASYTVNLNNEWRVSSDVGNPNGSLYDGVYESYSNYNVGGEFATMIITIKNYKKFSLYIRCYSGNESNYDYMMVGQLDKTITGSTSISDTTLVKAHTKGNSQSGTEIGDYTLVEYDNITEGSHTISIVYKKDATLNKGADRGYVLISKNNEKYSTVSQITATYDNNNENYSLSSLLPIKYIDYSNLMFVMDDSGSGDSGSGDSGSGDSGSGGEDTTVSYKLYYLDYWLGTGIDGKIYLSTEANNFSINTTTGDFVSLNGAITLLGNVSFTVGGLGSSRYIQFDSSEFGSIIKGQTCYFRVQCKSGLLVFYLCFKVKVTDTNFTHYTSTIGDCTLWLSFQHGGIYLSYSGDDTMYIYPVKNNYSNGKLVDGEIEICDTFAHGHFDTNKMSNLTLNYNCDALNTIDIECEVGRVVSLISPRCATMADLSLYLHNSPLIEISDNI